MESSSRLESMSNGLTKSNGVWTDGEAAADLLAEGGASRVAEEASSLSRDGGVVVTGEWSPEEG